MIGDTTLSVEDSRISPKFWKKVSQDANGCWVWSGYKSRDGYALFHMAWHKVVQGHRLTWITANGEVPDGHVLDHLCGNRACVNPAHLEPVSNYENLMRGNSTAAKNLAKTHCPKGHPYDEENTVLEPYGDGFTRRRCKTCRREQSRAAYLKKQMGLK